ncbi:MAG TPA: hypothetical protein VFR99_11120 [Marmoricola sp.]|nr:hypothetical protein [Marmoricola sp.]
MLRRWLACLVVGVMAFVGTALAVSALTSHPAVRPVEQPGRLVMVGMPSLTWSHVTPTRMPTLWRLVQRGAVAAQATMVLGSHSCSNQSWLTFSAGTPTGFGHPPPKNGEPSQPSEGPRPCSDARIPTRGADALARFPRWDVWQRYGHTRGAGVHIGKVAATMASAGHCVAAAGGSAGLGAADQYGVVRHYTRDVDKVDLEECPVTLIGLPGPDDGYLSRLLHRVPADTTIVVSGMADESGPSTLHTLVVAGPGVPHGLLTSLSTRQPGFVQTSDLSALVLSRLGRDAPVLPDGRPPQVRPVSSATGPVTQVRGLVQALDVEAPMVPGFIGGFLAAVGLAALVGLAVWGVRRRAPRSWFAAVGALCAAMPVSTFLAGLVPWWRSGHPQATLAAVVVGTALLLAALALLGPWRRWVTGPMLFLALATIFVITEDVVHGSRLQFISLLGLQPVYGGRYYGQGNVGYALFATCALLVAAVLAGLLLDGGHHRLATLTVALIGLAAVVVDGFPSWGADGGGPLAMIPAFAYLALNAAGMELTWRRLALIAAGTVAVVGGFAVLDYLRPPRFRTHLGNFVADLVQTGKPSGLQRIFTENWKMLTANWLNMTVALLLVATMLVLLFPQVAGRPLQPLLSRVTFLGTGLAAVAVCWLLAFFANDSGTGIPPSGLLVAAPLLVVLAASLPHPGSPTGPEPPEEGGREESDATRPRTVVS